MQLIEPPIPDRVIEITRSALHQAEQALLALIAARVDGAVIARLLALISVSDDDVGGGENLLALIKAAPGNVSLDTMLREISKLEAIRAIGLPRTCSPASRRTSSRAGVPAQWSSRPATA